MNRKTIVVLLFMGMVIVAGIPGSFARPQYLSNLTKVYGSGSCGACHVVAPGGGPRDSSRQRNFNGQRSSNRTFPLNSYGMLFENRPDHVTDPDDALVAIGAPPAVDTTVAPAKTTPGFGIVASLAGLFACALRWHKK